MTHDLKYISLPFHLPNGTLVSLQNFDDTDIDHLAQIETAITATPWLIEHFRSSVASSHICMGAKIGDQWAGYIVCSLAAGEAEILLIGVAKSWQKKGLATRLLENAETLLMAYANEMFLEVRESNEPAIRLYEKMGFNCLGRRKNYYPSVVTSSKREDALIFGKNISGTLCL